MAVRRSAGSATIVLVLLILPSGGLSLPLALVSAGLLLALVQGGYERKPSPAARWLLNIGLGLFLVEVVWLVALGISNSF